MIMSEKNATTTSTANNSYIPLTSRRTDGGKNLLLYTVIIGVASRREIHLKLVSY